MELLPSKAARELREALSIKALQGGNTPAQAYNHMSKQLCKALDIAKCDTVHDLFHTFVLNHPLEEAEYIQLLFTAADILDARRPFCPACLCTLIPSGRLGVPDVCPECGTGDKQ